MGQLHVKVLASLLTHKLVGIYDISRKRGMHVSGKYEARNFQNIESLLEKCDAVVIAVPTENHYEYAKLALEYDCHILVEKPITQTVAQARFLMDLAGRKKKTHTSWSRREVQWSCN